MHSPLHGQVDSVDRLRRQFAMGSYEPDVVKVPGFVAQQLATLEPTTPPLVPATRPEPKRQRIGVTARQLVVLRAIRAHMVKHGWSPSVRDLMDATGITSLQGVIGHLKALEDHGLIVRGPGNRQIALTVASSKWVEQEVPRG